MVRLAADVLHAAARASGSRAAVWFGAGATLWCAAACSSKAVEAQATSGRPDVVSGVSSSDASTAELSLESAASHGGSFDADSTRASDDPANSRGSGSTSGTSTAAAGEDRDASSGADSSPAASSDASTASAPSSIDDEPASVVPPSNVMLEPSGWYAGHALKDMDCLTEASVSERDWGVYLASRRYLLESGWTEQYFTDHFCVIDIVYEFRPIGVDGPYGAGEVAYKATFAPYEQSWEHQFPVVIDGEEPVLTDGVATIDEAKGHYPPELLPMIQSVMSPSEVIATLEAIAGPLVSDPGVNMGPPIGIDFVRLYAAASQTNPDSVECWDQYIIYLIDVETGELLEPQYTGGCP